MTRRPGSQRLAPLGFLALGALTLGALAGCASAPTRFFTLDPVAPTQAATPTYPAPPVKVVAVNIPPALDREELVSEASPGVVKVHDFEHWEAPLGLTARQVLIQDLAARLPAGEVLGPASPGGDGVTALSVDIVSFQAGPQGARMQAAWSASLPSAAGPQVFRAPLTLLQVPGGSSDGADTARAFSLLLGQLADQVAATLPAQAHAMMMRPAAAMRTQTTTTQSRTEVRSSHRF